MLLTTDCPGTHVNFTEILGEALPGLASASSEDLSLEDAPRLRRIVLFGRKHRPWAVNADRIMASGAALDEEALSGRAGIDPEETAVVMIYTSGTTAAPKACELSHASLQRSWALYSRTVSLAQGEKVWDPMPFFHSGGIGLMTGIMACGATIVTILHFDPDVIVDLIWKHRIEHIYPGFHLLGLPILQSPKYDKARFQFVRTMVVIGPLGTVRWIQRQLPDHARVPYLFGMSEGSGLVTLTPLDCEEDLRLTVSGKASNGVELRIVSDYTGEVVAPGRTGEIQFRGGGAFRGYYKDPRTTRDIILEGGWIRTGDLGRIDEQGWLTYLGRLKDVLRIGVERGHGGDRVLPQRSSGCEIRAGDRQARRAAGRGAGGLRRAQSRQRLGGAGSRRFLQGPDRALQDSTRGSFRQRMADVDDQDPEGEAARVSRGAVAHGRRRRAPPRKIGFRSTETKMREAL